MLNALQINIAYHLEIEDPPLIHFRLHDAVDDRLDLRAAGVNQAKCREIGACVLEKGERVLKCICHRKKCSNFHGFLKK